MDLDCTVPVDELERRWRTGQPVSPWRVVVAMNGIGVEVLVWSPIAQRLLSSIAGLTIEAVHHLAPVPAARSDRDPVPGTMATTLLIATPSRRPQVTVPGRGLGHG